MKNFNHFFKRYAWLFAMLYAWGGSTQLLAMDADSSGVQIEINGIADETDWSEQIYQLNDLFDDDSNPESLNPQVQTALFDLISKIFTGRLPEYKKSLGANSALPDLNLLLINAQRSPMLSQEQKTNLTGFQRTLSVEQIVLQNQTEKKFDQQLNNVLSAAGSAGSTTFDQLIQSFFFQQLNNLFKARITQTVALQDKLNTAFTRTKGSTLIQDSNKAEVESKQEILSIEASLRKIAKEATYATALADCTKLQTQDQAKKFEEFTQNLNFSTITQLFDNRDNKGAQEITALIDLLTQASTTSLLTDAQKTQIKTMLASLATEKNIIDAMAKPDFASMLTALRDITNASASQTAPKPSGNAQKLYSAALQKLFNAKPANNLQAAKDLLGLLNSALTNPLLLEADKGMVQGWIATLQNDITNLAISDDLKKALAKGSFSEKADALNTLLKDNNGKAITDATKAEIFSAINQLFTSRPKLDPAALAKLKDLLTTAAASGLLTDADKAKLAAMQTELDADLVSAKLAKELQDILNIQDPKARLAALQKFMADNAGKTLPADIQKMLQDGIQKLVDSRSNDPAFLADLANFVGGLGNSNLLSPDFKTKMSSDLTAINTDKEKALLNKQLQDILNIQDPKARLAALQKFMADNAGKTLPADIQKMLQDGIQKLVDSRSNDPAFLADLANFVGGLGSSNLLSPDFKTKMSSDLTAINADKEKALVNKSLQDIMAMQDPKARLAALQKFMADNTGKTLTPEQQKMLQDGISQLMSNRTAITDPTVLSDLAKFVGNLGSSNLLSPDFKTKAAGDLAGINADLDKANIGKSLQDIMAIQDPKARLAALQKFMADNTGKTLTPEQQKMLQDGINQLMSNRAAITDPTVLSDLAKFAGSLGSSNLLSPDFKTKAAGDLAGINADLDKANIGKSLQDIMAIQDPKARLAALQKFMADNAGKTLTPEQQKMLQDGINQLMSNRAAITDPTVLSDLAKFAGSLGSSNLLSPDFKTKAAGDLAGINADLDKANIGKSLQDIAGLGDAKLQANALSNFINSNQGKTLTTEQQKTLQDSLKKAFDSRSALDPASLGSLAKAATGAAQPNLVGADGVSVLQQQILPGLKKDTDNADVLTGMQKALAETDLNKKADLVNQVLANSTGKDLTPATQAQLGQGLQSLIAAKPTDPATIGKLASVLNQAKDSSAIDAASQQAIKAALPALTNPAALGSKALSLGSGLNPSIPGTQASQPGLIPGAQVNQQQSSATLPGLQNPNQLGATSLPGAGTNALPGAQPTPLAGLPGLQNPNQLGATSLPGAGLNALPGTPPKPLAGLPGLSNPNQLGATSIPGAGSNALPGTQAKPFAGLPGLRNPNQLGATSIPGAGLNALPGTQPKPLGGLPGLSNPNQLGATPLPGAGLQGNNATQPQALGGLKPLTNQLSMPGSQPQFSGVQQPKPLAALQQPGQIASLPGAQAAPTLSGAKGVNDFKLASGQAQFKGLQQTPDLAMPGAGNNAQASTSHLPGLQKPGMVSLVPGTTTPGQQVSGVPAPQAIAQQASHSGDASEQALINEIQAAMQQPSLREKMLGMNAVLAKIGNKQFSPALHNAYAAAVQQIFEARNSLAATGSKEESKKRKKALRSKEKRKKIKSKKSPSKTKPKKKKKKKTSKKTATTATQPTNPTEQTKQKGGSKKKKRRAK